MMTESHKNTDASQPEFVAELKPHRSLSREGFIVLMVLVSLTCFISGALFMVIGAWPVFIFFGLDIFIIWLAFKLNYRSGRIKERVSVARDALIVQQFDPNGKMKEHVFNPFWTRFEVERHDEIGITSMKLTSRQQQLSIGSFLNPDDRESFSEAFASAISRVKT